MQYACSNFKEKNSFFINFDAYRCVVSILFYIFIILGISDGYPGARSLYGGISVDDSVKNLVVCAPFKRLKEIDISGASRYFRKLPSYSLFDHSFGIYSILKRYKVPLDIQIVGFSYPLFQNACSLKASNHTDNINLAYKLKLKMLDKTDIGKILKNHNLALKDIIQIRKSHPAIYAVPPNLSAHTLEFTLRLAYMYSVCTKKDINLIMKNLNFKNNRWYFTNKSIAKKFAKLSLYFADKYWGSPTNYIVNKWFLLAVSRATKLGIINFQDIFYGSDRNLLVKLLNSKDKWIKNLMMQCSKPFRFYKIADKSYDELYKPKFKGIDPLVMLDGKLLRLSVMDDNFKKDFNALDKKFKQGIKISYKNIDDSILELRINNDLQ